MIKYIALAALMLLSLSSCSKDSDGMEDLMPPKTEEQKPTDGGESADEPSKEEGKMTIEINGHKYAVALADNRAAADLQKMLPLQLNMNELNGNEKYVYLEKGLTTSASVPVAIHAGDLMLFGSDCLVLFYKSFATSYSYTPIGKLENADDIAAVVGSGNINVKIIAE